MNKVNFSRGGPAALQQLQQAQQMAAALQMAQARLAATPPDDDLVDTGTYKTLNFAPLLRAAQERKLQEQAKAASGQVAQLGEQYQEELARALQAYTQKRVGGEVPPANGMGPPQRIPGNPQAFRDGLLSPYPEVQAMAQADQKQFEELYKSLFGRASVKSGVASLAAGQDPAQLTAPLKSLGVDGTVALTDEEGNVRLAPGAGYKQELGPKGEQLNRNLLTNRTSGAQGQTINIGGQQANTEFLKSEAKALSDKKSELEPSFARGLRALTSAEQAIEGGAIMGTLAKERQWMTTAMQTLGLTSAQTKEVLAETENLNASMAKFVLAAIKATGTNPSNSDRTYAELAAGGRENTPEGLKMLLAAAKADMFNDVILHNRRAERLEAAVPDAALAKIAVPDLGSWAGGKAPKGFERTQNVSGYQLSPEGLLMPAKPSAVPPKDWRTDPAERQRRINELLKD